jgi:ribonuclease T2
LTAHSLTPRIISCAVAALLALCAPAQGKDDDCILDHCADRAKTAQERAPEEAGSRPAGVAGAFDFYVLALSWSAGFCAVDANSARHKQCNPGSKLGFVAHGLWPQNERGYPSDCSGPRSPSRIALERAKGVFPDEGLARYEWRKHGTCTGRSPSDYFADVARAKESVTIPQPFVGTSGPQTYSPIDIERAFFAANPRLRPGMMAVGCRKGVLQDVLICMSKDLREFRACPEVARRNCRAREISVPAPL